MTQERIYNKVRKGIQRRLDLSHLSSIPDTMLNVVIDEFCNQIVVNLESACFVPKKEMDYEAVNIW